MHVSLSCVYTSDVSFGFLRHHRTVSKVKEKGCLDSKKSCTFKIFYDTKNVNVSHTNTHTHTHTLTHTNMHTLAHTHTHTNTHTRLNTQILLSNHGTFFHCFNPFSGFSSQSNPHSEDLFLILRNT